MTKIIDEILGGGSAAVFLLPAVLGIGAVAIQPLGPHWLPVGILGAFAATILVALVRAVTGGPLHVNAPRPTQAAMLAALMSEVAATPAFQASTAAGDDAARAAMMLAAAFLALAAAGVMQAALGAMRLGVVIRFIPFPLIAGFTNGFAIAIALRQVPLMMDGFALVCGLAAAAATLAAPRLSKAAPAGLVGLAVGGAVYALSLAFLPAERLGPVIGALPSGLPFAWSGGDILRLMAVPGFLESMASPILTTAVALAVVSSLQSLVSLAAADALMRRRSNGDHELIRQGAGNIAAALCGGTAVGGSPLYTRIAVENGGRGRGAQFTLAAVLLAMVLALSGVVALIPVSVMAGVVVATMIGTLDPWSIGLARRLWSSRRERRRMAPLALDVAVVTAVTLLVVTSGAMMALAIGMVASVVIYLWRSSAGIVRRAQDAAHIRSETARDAAALDLLERNGGRIRMLSLQGPVFFGSAEGLADQIEAQADADTIILDLSRVATIDSTGVQVLQRIDRGLAKAGRVLLLAGSSPTPLADLGWEAPARSGRLFDDANAALAEAEDRLLATLRPEAETELALSEHPMLRGLSPAQIDILASVAEYRVFPAGEELVLDDAVWLLARGRVGAWRGGARVAGFRAGAVVGDAALPGAPGRKLTARAEGDGAAFRLLAEDIDMLGRIDWRIPYTLTRNILAEATARNEALSDLVWER